MNLREAFADFSCLEKVHEKNHVETNRFWRRYEKAADYIIEAMGAKAADAGKVGGICQATMTPVRLGMARDKLASIKHADLTTSDNLINEPPGNRSSGGSPVVPWHRRSATMGIHHVRCR
ncbi:UNVERIFIED_ORG: hypothetical protein J2W85_005860 [Ensifer adhaerens]|nr:hypothetical protein [Ensifer adhaerens]